MNLELTRFNTLSDVKKALLLSVILGASSVISFKTPFMPVPWIIQNQLCLMIGYVFGARVGFMTALCFLIEGVLGAPFFSLGRSGLGMILGPSGGYLLAYPIASCLSGYLKTKWAPKAPYIFLNLIVSNLVIYTIGVMQLSLFVGFKKAIVLGFIPFVALDVVKSVFATAVLRFKSSR
jgi:biotin transport system substrate-specific component